MLHFSYVAASNNFMIYSARIKNEVEVEAPSLKEAKTAAIKKFKELLDKDEVKVQIEEELDSYD